MQREALATMRAARVTAPGDVTVEDVPPPVVGSSAVLVRTAFASICGSDLHTLSGRLSGDTFPCPAGYPGHEAVGEVVESRSALFSPGDSVLLVPEPTEAAAFADLQVVPEDHAVGLPPGADPRSMLMAQQLGTVIFALKRMWPGAPGRVAAVLGAGPAGLHFMQLLKARGFDTVVVGDLSPSRLRKARELDADRTVHGGEVSFARAVLEETSGEGADLVIEAAGHDETRAEVMRSVRVGGRIGLYGLPEQSGEVRYPYEVLFRRQPSIEIVSGAQSEPGLASFREAIAAIEAGGVASGSLVSHTYDVGSIDEAFRIATAREDGHGNGALKVCLSFG